MAHSILRLPQTIKKVGLSKSTIYLKISNNQFPKPILLGDGGRSVGFIEKEIDDWIQQRINASRPESTEV
tara:strand:+ start:17795 stop:18004 length:210 start_codon:yes stop_codon:yes gene_type:complete